MKFKRLRHYKYELTEDFSSPTPFRPPRWHHAPTLAHPFVSLSHTGGIFFLKGYAWDGASGPAMDTQSIMRAALVHDGFYQLMREAGLDLSYRKPADQLLRRMCREDGMSWLRAWWVYWAVRIFGKGAASGN